MKASRALTFALLGPLLCGAYLGLSSGLKHFWEGDGLWQHIERHSLQTVGYMADPKDGGDYQCFVALDAQGSFARLSIVAIGRLGFGSLADQAVGCLENIFVPTPYRRGGIGSALFEKALDAAWQAGAVHVWWSRHS